MRVGRVPTAARMRDDGVEHAGVGDDAEVEDREHEHRRDGRRLAQAVHDEAADARGEAAGERRDDRHRDERHERRGAAADDEHQHEEDGDETEGSERGRAARSLPQSSQRAKSAATAGRNRATLSIQGDTGSTT
jgi:hypothetical protein